MGLLTQEDPIGIAGGLNLYGYANGDPINFSDPFGLMACDPPGTCPNRNKLLVGAMNFGLGFGNVVGGAGLITGSAVTGSVHFGMLTGPATAIGGYRITIGLAGMSRGAQQMSEALTESVSQESPRNFLGLLPAGQAYDDSTEPTPVDYARLAARDIKEDFWAAVGKLVKDFFAVGNDGR